MVKQVGKKNGLADGKGYDEHLKVHIIRKPNVTSIPAT